MFTRNLKKEEVELIKKMERFVRKNHSGMEGHDHSHVLEVTRLSIEIGKRIDAPLDPFVVIFGALLHDIGRISAPTEVHGLVGASLAEEFLEACRVDREQIGKITRIITRHTPASMIPPEPDAEKVVFDADRIEVLGRIGVLRGAMNKRGSIEDILEFVIRKRSKGFDAMYYDESREISKHLYRDTMDFLEGLRKDLDRRCKHIKNLELPMESGAEVVLDQPEDGE